MADNLKKIEAKRNNEAWNSVHYAYIADLTFEEYKKFSEFCGNKIAILALGTTTWGDGSTTLNCVVDKRDVCEEDINTLATFLGIAL